jgi:stage V sporulation protein S
MSEAPTGTSSSIELKVAASNNVQKTATAIVKNIQEGKQVSVSAVGPEAVNQAVKSVAAARGKIASNGVNLLAQIGFRTFKQDESDAREKTAMIFKLLIQ